jgi:hypothetical protein
VALGAGVPIVCAYLDHGGSCPDGLANASGLVGRNLTFHHFPAVNFTIDQPALSFTALESHLALDDLHASDPKRGFIRGGVVAEINMLVEQPLAFAFVGFPGYPQAPLGTRPQGLPAQVPARGRDRRRAGGPADGGET